jgi:nitric oxide reductase NorD protein
MEEQVGQLWHRLITRVARSDYPQAVVLFENVRRPVSILFRALGGDAGLCLQTSTATDSAARRGLLARIAGVDTKIELAWRDTHALYLPQALSVFPDAALNRDLYLWLAALAAQQAPVELPWLAYNQALTQAVLAHYPGLRPRYRRLVAAVLAQRPDPQRLPADEAAQEGAVQAALQDPGSVAQLPHARRPPQPVVLWMHPFPPRTANDTAHRDDSADAEADGNT